jgi:arginine decarboxylase
MNQGSAPVAENLSIFLKDPVRGFGGPGHHLGHGAPSGAKELIGSKAFADDILTPKGLDDRTKSFGVMEEAEALAADAWGADKAFFGTSGSTQNVQAAILSVAAPGDTILVAADEHRTAFSLGITSGLQIFPIGLAYDTERDIENGVTVHTIRAALEQHPEAKAVVIVSPTFYGTTVDVAAIADLVHRHGIPLIVDSAWGGALAFCDQLPPCPLTLGADAMITSVHKTMGALAQGSMLFLKGGRIDAARAQRTLDCLQTTSPSVPIFASMDLARRNHALHGQEMWTKVIERTLRTAARINALPGLAVYGDERLETEGVHHLDRTKLVVDVSGLWISGFDADDWLQRQRRVSIVLSDARHIVAVFAVGTTDADADALISALEAMCEAAKGGEISTSARAPGYDTLVPQLSDVPCAIAAAGKTERIIYEEAVGRIAAEVVAPTPPEIPRLMPGWVVRPQIAAWLRQIETIGAYIPDADGERNGTVLVLKESG